jgi:Ubiquitin-binding domain/Ubiquitin family
MGAGCACQSSIENDSSDRIRLHRQGNLTFYLHGKAYTERLMSGKGCKKTQAWQTTLTREEIDLKIKEFWDTRVEGSPVVWEILKKACQEPDPEKAESLLKSYGIILNNGVIQQTYDDRGYRYDLPPFVINPAVKYGEVKAVTKINTIKTETLELVFRCAGVTDCVLNLKTDFTVKKVKEKYLETIKQDKIIRLFFNGKELKDDNMLGQYPITNKVVVQVFLKT